MSEPSPGPWYARGRDIHIANASRIGKATTSDAGIASANAALMASAPQLLLQVDAAWHFLDALWHFSTCPYDHCERCIADEAIIKSIGREVNRRREDTRLIARVKEHKKHFQEALKTIQNTIVDRDDDP